jgi:hypothetical protein
VSDDRDLIRDRNINVFNINVFEWLLKATRVRGIMQCEREQPF